MMAHFLSRTESTQQTSSAFVWAHASWDNAWCSVPGHSGPDGEVNLGVML
jgi:hypothetical protein